MQPRSSRSIKLSPLCRDGVQKTFSTLLTKVMARPVNPVASTPPRPAASNRGKRPGGRTKEEKRGAKEESSVSENAEKPPPALTSSALTAPLMGEVARHPNDYSWIGWDAELINEQVFTYIIYCDHTFFWMQTYILLS